MGPGPAAQQGRLGGALQRLTAAFAAQRAALAADPDAADPEQVLVLEIAGEIDEFARAVQRVPGLEFLAEEIEDKVEPDDFAAVDRDGRRRRYARQLFLVMSDQTAWQQLLGLWQRFQQGEDFPRGLAPFRHLFALLRELRPWDDRDRLERTGALAAWERELGDLSDELVDFEVELWLRSDEQRRAAAVTGLRADLQAAGGELVSELVHQAVDYHGVLGRVPASRLLDAVTRHQVRWLRTGPVRFFHASGQMAVPARVEDFEVESAMNGDDGPPDGEPKIAVLDGLPLGRHILLRNRIVVDDPDTWDQTIPVARRIHGTGMASVVVHGDLNAGSVPLRSPVYIRPILSADAPAWVRGPREELPRHRLAVDVVNEAVTRLFEGDAVAAGVQVVVLAVGDAGMQFDRFVSPLARLLDWLAFRHEILFLVSAGNHTEALEIPADTGTGDPQELQHELLCAVRRTAALRRLLSPAESVNALTIGAAHEDGSATVPADDRVEPIVTPDLPNLACAVGGGVRRAIKPDILLSGGRQLVRLEPPREGGRRLASIPPTLRAPGLRMASPGRAPGALDETRYDTGTSFAAASGGHHSGHLLDTLASLRDIYGGAMPGADLDAVILKAALVHGARWGSARAFLDHALTDVGLPRSRDAIARVVGYGRAAPEQVLVCDDHMVTAIAAGRIDRDDAHAFRLPLPPSLAARTDRRRITLTLAWLTPINPRHRHYRRAALKLEPDGPAGILGDRDDADMHGSRRGTVQHEVLVGDQAAPYAPGSALELVVGCRADAGALEAEVPYALIASLEIPAAAGLSIYEEVRQALRVPLAVRAARA